MRELLFTSKAWEDLGWWMQNHLRHVKKIYHLVYKVEAKTIVVVSLGPINKNSFFPALTKAQMNYQTVVHRLLITIILASPFYLSCPHEKTNPHLHSFPGTDRTSTAPHHTF